MESTALSTRAIGRGAVRESLAGVALPQFIEHGFDAVTFEALAVRAGVSRSTLLRYFPTKEDMVLFVFDPVGDAIVAALSTTAVGEGEWTALRRCLDPAVAFLSDSDQGLERMRLIWATPALYARLHEKQATWRTRMVEQLAAQAAPDSVGVLVRRTRVASALECLVVALEAWLSEDGRSELGHLLDQTFEAISTTR